MLISVTRTPPLENGVVDLITPTVTPSQRRSPSPANMDPAKTTEDMEKNNTVEKTKQKGPEDTEKTKEDMEKTNSDTVNMEMRDAEKILKQEMLVGDQTLSYPE